MLQGVSNRDYLIEFSTNLSNWSVLLTNRLEGTNGEVIDPQATGSARPEAATRRLAAEPRVQCRADLANSPSWVALAAFLDVESHPTAWRSDMLVRMRQRGWTQSSGSPAP